MDLQLPAWPESGSPEKSPARDRMGKTRKYDASVCNLQVQPPDRGSKVQRERGKVSPGRRTLRRATRLQQEKTKASPPPNLAHGSWKVSLFCRVPPPPPKGCQAKCQPKHQALPGGRFSRKQREAKAADGETFQTRRLRRRGGRTALALIAAKGISFPTRTAAALRRRASAGSAPSSPLSSAGPAEKPALQRGSPSKAAGDRVPWKKPAPASANGRRSPGPSAPSPARSPCRPSLYLQPPTGGEGPAARLPASHPPPRAAAPQGLPPTRSRRRILARETEEEEAAAAAALGGFLSPPPQAPCLASPRMRGRLRRWGCGSAPSPASAGEQVGEAGREGGRGNGREPPAAPGRSGSERNGAGEACRRGEARQRNANRLRGLEESERGGALAEPRGPPQRSLPGGGRPLGPDAAPGPRLRSRAHWASVSGGHAPAAPELGTAVWRGLVAPAPAPEPPRPPRPN
ncbi:uncharacterized protein LOC143819904 isoform X1 [Paroedura picta]|uniref:uncharacterized protein LOC143819904 isoform X1 n=1 Tax=Paroedura picta TaxID=143630 RepID=UPI004055F1F0